MKLIHLDPRQRQELERRRHETHDKRIYERLSAVLWVADGKTRFEVADLLGCSVRQLAEWLRLFRNRGLDALCTLHTAGRALPDREKSRTLPPSRAGSIESIEPSRYEVRPDVKDLNFSEGGPRTWFVVVRRAG
jgi:DNA-binding CsgD family transcriptional regulator